MKINIKLRKILLLICMFAVSLQVCGVDSTDPHTSQWYETIDWYENELGVQQDHINSLHLAVTLAECFSHDPEDIVAFDKAIQFWLSCGGDINQTFTIQDFFALGQWGQPRDFELSEKYKNKQISVLMFFIGNDTLVQALLKNHANVIVNNECLLDCWADEYNDMRLQDKNNKIHACHACIDAAYRSQHHALQLLFTACQKSQQEAFLQKHSEFLTILQS